MQWSLIDFYGSSMPNEVMTVMANFGFEVEMMDQSRHRHRCVAKQSLGRLLTGDRVTTRWSDHELNLIAVLPRKNLLQRQVGRMFHKTLAIASNLDCIAIVCSPVPTMKMRFFDAIIIGAIQQRIVPILVLNKSDLADFLTWQNYLKMYYQHTTVDMLSVCALKTDTLSCLRQKTKHKRTLFVGASGVGKSTLLNALVGEKYAKTQPLSIHLQGKHTTSNSICYDLDDSTQLIDMPGIRDFRLSALNEMAIAETYADLIHHIRRCQFRNCQHKQEPNCVLRAAVDGGKILPERLINYQYFQSLRR